MQTVLREDVLATLRRSGITLVSGPEGEGETAKGKTGDLHMVVDWLEKDDVIFFNMRLYVVRPVYLTKDAQKPYIARMWYGTASGLAPKADLLATLRGRTEGMLDWFIRGYRQDNPPPDSGRRTP